jgi:hypothetical protein
MVQAFAVAVLLSRQSSAAAAPEPARAEYAVRWNPAQGGPATAAEVLAFLEGSRDRGETWEVRYFDLEPPPGAPAGATTILRRRTNAGGRSEIRLKYRRARPLDAAWGCPAGGAFRKDEEVDIGFGGSGAPTRVYAYSCSLEAAEPPSGLGAVPKKCASRMVRYEAGSRRSQRYKVEEWTLPGGGVRLEISRSAPNSVDELARFAELVERLRARGVRPLDESKTELGSRCP